MKNISLMILINFLLFATTSLARWSEQLPISFMRELSEAKLWTAEDEVKRTSVSVEIDTLFQSIKNEKNIETIVNSLIDTNFNSSNSLSYGLKIRIFRYLIENQQFAKSIGLPNEKILKIEAAWKNRYIHSAALLLRGLNVSGYAEIVDSFLNQVKTGSIKVYDLSSENRSFFDSQIGKSHGVSLLQKKDNQYAVTGFYFESQKIFALDFARPLGETLISFAHEIVHAGDPRLATYRAEFEKYYHPVKNILAKLMGDNSSPDLINAMLTHVFFEIGREELLAKIQNQAKALVQNIKDNDSNQTTSLNAADEEILRKWIKAVIGLSIENEYRAYGFSVIAYVQFKNQLNIIQDSSNREKFVSSIRDGDKRFVERIAQGMNPFHANLNSYQNIVQRYQLRGDSRLTFDRNLSLIESMYLDEVRGFIANLSNQFSNTLRTLRTEIQVAPDLSPAKVFPDWTNSENMNSPSNPYSLITARVSTMWVIRVRENIISLVKDLTEMRKSLLVLRAGILDFANLSASELNLLNLVDKSNTDGSDLSQEMQCSGNYSKINPSINYQKYEKYFGNLNWSSAMVSSEYALPASRLIEQLLKLKLIQGLAWLEQGFPDIKNNIVGAKVFMQKLREQLYDTEDLSYERAQQLQTELIEAIQYSSFSGDEIKKIDYLIFFLASAHKISFERSWNEATHLFSQRQLQVMRLLNNLGVDIQFNQKNFEEYWANEMDDFENQVEDYQDSCEDMPGTISSVTAAPLKIDGESYSVNYVCSGRQVYFIRLPCGASNSISLMTRNKTPRVRPIYNGRFVELVPYSKLHIPND